MGSGINWKMHVLHDYSGFFIKHDDFLLFFYRVNDFPSVVWFLYSYYALVLGF